MQERGLIKINQDYPQIIINSIPAPELIYDKISDKDLEAYIKGLKELDKFGVDFIVMVCNTIHLFYDRLQKEVNTPILNLREELKKKLLENYVKKVTILGTPSTIKKGLYEFEEIDYLNPSVEEMEELTNAIFNFNKGVEKDKQIQTVKRICQKYLKRGSEIVVLGCTEFAMMLNNENLQTIDTIDVLAESVVNKIRRCPNQP